MLKAYIKTAIHAAIVGLVTALFLAQALPAATENPEGPLFLLPVVIVLAALLLGCLFVMTRKIE